MLSQIFFYNFDALRLILWLLVVSSQREVYTARPSCIWVVKEGGWGEGVRNFILLFVHYIQRLPFQ